MVVGYGIVRIPTRALAKVGARPENGISEVAKGDPESEATGGQTRQENGVKERLKYGH